MKFAATLQYQGKNYAGFQLQKNKPSIQGELERALEILLKEKTRIYTAGRTDSGVHAEGQVIHFNHQKKIEPHRFLYSMNSILPQDISLIYGHSVPENFHARFSCLSREYAYHIYSHPYQMASFNERAWWIRQQLDAAAIKKAIQHLIGEIDFAAFTKAAVVKSAQPTRRRIDEIRLIAQKPEYWLYYKASGFLHNMIRILTDTLLSVGLGKLQPDAIPALLEKRDRTQTGTTLPAYPLTFVNARYKEYSTPKEFIPFYAILKNASS